MDWDDLKTNPADQSTWPLHVARLPHSTAASEHSYPSCGSTGLQVQVSQSTRRKPPCPSGCCLPSYPGSIRPVLLVRAITSHIKSEWHSEASPHVPDVLTGAFQHVEQSQSLPKMAALPKEGTEITITSRSCNTDCELLGGAASHPSCLPTTSTELAQIGCSLSIYSN